MKKIPHLATWIFSWMITFIWTPKRKYTHYIYIWMILNKNIFPLFGMNKSSTKTDVLHESIKNMYFGIIEFVGSYFWHQKTLLMTRLPILNKIHFRKLRFCHPCKPRSFKRWKIAVKLSISVQFQNFIWKLIWVLLLSIVKQNFKYVINKWKMLGKRVMMSLKEYKFCTFLKINVKIIQLMKNFAHFNIFPICLPKVCHHARIFVRKDDLQARFLCRYDLHQKNGFFLVNFVSFW